MRRKTTFANIHVKNMTHVTELELNTRAFAPPFVHIPFIPVGRTKECQECAKIFLQVGSSVVSFAAVIRVVTQCSSPTNGCSLELCIPFHLLLRTIDMHVTVSSCTNHISCYICRQRSRFPRYGSLILIGQFKERNAELE